MATVLQAAGVLYLGRLLPVRCVCGEVLWQLIRRSRTITRPSQEDGSVAWPDREQGRRCTVSGNFAGNHGVGILVEHTALLTNCTVSGNSAGTDGGGIWATTANLLNCTIVENSAHTGGAFFHSPGGTFSLKNTIIALNLVETGGSNPDVSGTFTSSGHNLIGDGTGGNRVHQRRQRRHRRHCCEPDQPEARPTCEQRWPHQDPRTPRGQPGNRSRRQRPRAGHRPARLRLRRKKDGNGDVLAIVDIGAFER